MNKTIIKPARRSTRQPKSDVTSKSPSPLRVASTEEKGAAPHESQRPPSKTALVIGMLTRTGGASLDELVAATGWQPHTTRAALTGLRKKSHPITKSKVDGVTRYTIAAATRA